MNGRRDGAGSPPPGGDEASTDVGERDDAAPPGPTLVELGIRVGEIKESELDAQPFGVIRLDTAGRVLSYNLYEEYLARRDRRDVVGKSFFFEIAPCTRVRRFYGRFLDGVARRSLHATFGFVFAFDHGERSVEITLIYREEEDVVWVLVRG